MYQEYEYNMNIHKLIQTHTVRRAMRRTRRVLLGKIQSPGLADLSVAM